MTHFRPIPLLPLIQLHPLPLDVDDRTPLMLQLAMRDDAPSSVRSSAHRVGALLHRRRLAVLDDHRRTGAWVEYASGLEALFVDTRCCDWFVRRPDSLAFGISSSALSASSSSSSSSSRPRTHDSLLGEYMVAMLALVALEAPRILVATTTTGLERGEKKKKTRVVGEEGDAATREEEVDEDKEAAMIDTDEAEDQRAILSMVYLLRRFLEVSNESVDASAIRRTLGMISPAAYYAELADCLEDVQRPTQRLEEMATLHGGASSPYIANCHRLLHQRRALWYARGLVRDYHQYVARFPYMEDEEEETKKEEKEPPTSTASKEGGRPVFSLSARLREMWARAGLDRMVHLARALEDAGRLREAHGWRERRRVDMVNLFDRYDINLHQYGEPPRVPLEELLDGMEALDLEGVGGGEEEEAEKKKQKEAEEKTLTAARAAVRQGVEHHWQRAFNGPAREMALLVGDLKREHAAAAANAPPPVLSLGQRLENMARRVPEFFGRVIAQTVGTSMAQTTTTTMAVDDNNDGDREATRHMSFSVWRDSTDPTDIERLPNREVDWFVWYDARADDDEMPFHWLSTYPMRQWQERGVTENVLLHWGVPLEMRRTWKKHQRRMKMMKKKAAEEEEEEAEEAEKKTT